MYSYINMNMNMKFIDINKKKYNKYHKKITILNKLLQKGKGLNNVFIKDDVIYEGEFDSNGQLSEGKKITYNSISDGKFDSNGQLLEGMLISNGKIFIGNFINNNLIEGIIINNNGVFEGKFEKNKIIEGRKITLNNYCEGIFENYQLTSGKKITNDNIFEGTFDPDENLIEGNVMASSNISSLIVKNGNLVKNKKIINGIIYEGTFNENDELIEGEKINNGTIFNGKFENNELKNGKIIDYGVIYEGTFKNGELTDGKKITLDCIREGLFKNNKLIKGTKTNFTSISEGEYDLNEVLIRGTMAVNIDRVFSGEFTDGELSKGTIDIGNGQFIYDGIFENGQCVKGTLIKKNGVIEYIDIDAQYNNNINVTTFEELYNFFIINETRLYIKENIGKYKISERQVEKVINNIRQYSGLTEDVQDMCIQFLRRLVEIFIYVPFDVYVKKIRSVALEVKSFINDNYQKYEKIYYVINGPINKSQTWVALLFFDILKNFLMSPENIQIKNKIIFMDKLPINRLVESAKILILMFDDMSYSGAQMSAIISDTNQSKNFDIYITTPYISTTAKNRILNKNINILFWNETEIIDSFYDMFTNFGLDESYKMLYKYFCTDITKISRKNIYNGFQCYKNIIPIYFDHKIADAISTFQKLLVFGIYPIDKRNGQCVMSSLIELCEKSDDKKNELIKKYNCSNYVEDIAFEHTCPQTFYKTFKYIFPCVDKIDDRMYKRKTLLELLNHCNNVINKFTN